MNVNLLDLFKKATGTEFTDRLSLYLSEDPEEVKKAMALIVPAVLSAFIKKTSTESNSEMLLQFIQYYASSHFSLPIESKDQMEEFIALGDVVLSNIAPVQLAPKEGPKTVIPLSNLRYESVVALKQITGCVFKELIFREILDNDLGAKDLSGWLQLQQKNVINAQKKAEKIVFPELSEIETGTSGESVKTVELKPDPEEIQKNILITEAEPLKPKKVIRLLLLAVICLIFLYFLRPENTSTGSSNTEEGQLLQDTTDQKRPGTTPTQKDSVLID
jgi:hypothetical protein